MTAEWALSIVVPIIKGKGVLRKCSCYGAVKLLVHGMGVKRLCSIVTVDDMQFGFMPERGTIDAVFILRKMQEECHVKR